MEIRKEIPYNEDGEQLSFITAAETVYVEDENGERVELPVWLSRLESKLSARTVGKNGTSFFGFQTDYVAVDSEHNSLEKVKELNTWSAKSPTLTDNFPHLWKRIQTKTQDASGVVSITNTEYQYCGSLGQTGLDAEWKEWIFRLTKSNKSETDIKATLEADLARYYTTNPDSNYQSNDFIPAGWKDDMQTVNETEVLQWCASRYKKNGVWSAFGNVHVFGRKPLDGVTNNNIYTVSPDIDPDKWESDRTLLISEILMDQDSGKISNFPTGTNYKWEDFVPNTDSTEIVYQATAYFQGNTCINIDAPVRITGPAGPGSDGNGIEFAYCALDHSDPTEGDFPEFIPNERHFSTSGGWYDTAGECPITKETPYQYTRRRLGQYTDENNWYWIYGGVKYGKSDNDSSVIDIESAPEGWDYGWSKPMLWSSWGVDGIDGDGVQYVYVRLTEAEYQFVSGNRNRWNFDGVSTDVDKGDISDPSNPNNPINFKYEYIPDQEIFTADDPIDWNAEAVFLTFSGEFIEYNGNDELIRRGTVKVSTYIRVPKDDNDDLINPKEYIVEFTYNGKEMPSYNAEGLFKSMVKFYRKPRRGDTYKYEIIYALNTPAGTERVLLDENIIQQKNTVVGYLVNGDEKEVTAPVLPGYHFVEVNGASRTQTIHFNHAQIVFYYEAD